MYFIQDIKCTFVGLEDTAVSAQRGMHGLHQHVFEDNGNRKESGSLCECTVSKLVKALTEISLPGNSCLARI